MTLRGFILSLVLFGSPAFTIAFSVLKCAEIVNWPWWLLIVPALITAAEIVAIVALTRSKI